MTHKLPKTFNTKNTRRIDLIHKSFDEGLSQEEQLELDRLTKEIDNYLSLVDPLPIENAKSLYVRLLLESTLKEIIVELTTASLHSGLHNIFGCIDKAKNKAEEALKQLEVDQDKDGNPSLMSQKQRNYNKMTAELGHEEAKYRVIEALKDLANKLEHDDFFDIYGCDIREGSVITSVEVTASYPWGG